MIKKSVPFYFWLVSLFFLLLSIYYFNNDSVIDVNIHDTYFIIHNSHLCVLLTVTYFFFGFIYAIFKILKIRLFTILSKIHSILTLGMVPVYFLGYFILNIQKHSKLPLFDDSLKLQWFITIIAVIFLFSQIILIFNIILSLLKHFSNKINNKS